MLDQIFGFVAIFLICWLGVGSGLVYFINLFRFQIPFSRTMVQEKIYDRATHKRVLTNKWVGATVTLVVSGGLTLWLGWNAGVMGIVMAVLGVAVGFLKGRHVLGNRKANVMRFVRSHMVYMEKMRTDAFLRREYNLELETVLKGR